MSTPVEIVIDSEFQSLIPPLSADEFAQLEANLVEHGCLSPLVVWHPTESIRPILLDGHNRYEICNGLGIVFDTVAVELPDREAAADWIDANQLGRRNLAPDQYSLLRGRRYNRQLKRERGGGDRRSEDSDRKRQNVGFDPTTSEVLAIQYGVTSRTIERDGQFAKAVEQLKEVDPEIEEKVVKGIAPAKGLIVQAASEVKKGKQEAKAESRTPLLGTRKDKAAAEIFEKAKDKATAILNGELGTIAQAKRQIADEKKSVELAAKAASIIISPDDPPPWEIIEGDCVERLAEIEAGSVRLVFADPPYNIDIPYGDHYDDKMDPEEFMEWSEEWMRAAVRTLAPDGSMWVLINDDWADVYGCLLRDVGLHRRSWIKWYEPFGENQPNNFNHTSRHLFYMVKDRKRFVFNRDAVSRPSDRQTKYGDKRADPGGKIWDDVWGINPPIPRLVGTAKERIPNFPTQLPLSLLRPIIGCASEPGDLVVDPFNGSGTTGVAAIEAGRRYVGIELGEKFARLARQRLKVAGNQEVANAAG